jgi:hypothetical protein
MKRKAIVMLILFMMVSAIGIAGYYSWLVDWDINAQVGPTYYWDGNPAEDVVIDEDLELFGGDSGIIGNYTLMLHANATGNRVLNVDATADEELGFVWTTDATHDTNTITILPGITYWVQLSYDVAENTTAGSYSISWLLNPPTP